jgi:hypothetical protein
VPRDAVTLWPEWAFALAHLGKRCENRTWTLRLDHLPLALCIHAGAFVGGANTATALEDGLAGLFHHASAAGWGLEHSIRKGADGMNVWISGRNEDGRVLPRTYLARRSHVAVAVFDRVDELEPGLFVRPDDPWAVGPMVWRAARVVTLREPLTCREGKLGLWSLTERHFATISTRLADAVLADAREQAAARTG